MNILGIIPARYASSRFPAKLLANVGGKSIIQRVYEQARKATLLQNVVIATDHDKIFQHVKSFGGQVCMTADTHVSGTDRCREALDKQNDSFDYVINIQGDEPFIQPQQINLLAGMLDGHVEIATLVKKLSSTEQLLSPHVVKAVLNHKKEALYFSRAAIPYQRDVHQDAWLNNHPYFKHIGMYAYRSDILRQLTTLPVSSLEKAESLEQLRWLQNGFRISVAETEIETVGIDTPEDLTKALTHLHNPQA